MQTMLFNIDEVRRLRLTTQQRTALIVTRCNEVNPNNHTIPLKEMLIETKRKFDNGELSWQKKENSFNNLMMINDERD